MLRVAQVGLGPIGLELVRRVIDAEALELVAAVDIQPALAGADVGVLLGTNAVGIAVETGLDSVLASARPDIVLHATGSHLPDVESQLSSIIGHGISVVSTCEELFYPYYRHPRLSDKLDTAARNAGVVLLGTGVNPGFVMDKLVVTLMAACDTVEHVRVRRVVDARSRRVPFQHKIGAGLTVAEFEARRDGLGHIGLTESAQMIGDAMGLPRERALRDEIEPHIAREPVLSDAVSVEAGQVAGIDELVTVEVAGRERVRLELRMALGATPALDAVTLDSSPRVALTIDSGVAGDQATAAMVLTCAPLVGKLEPGLRTMLDVPLRPATTLAHDG